MLRFLMLHLVAVFALIGVFATAAVLWHFFGPHLNDSANAASASQAWLPVVPSLRPADEPRDVLLQQLREGKLVCSRGYYAATDAITGELRFVQLDGRLVQCP